MDRLTSDLHALRRAWGKAAMALGASVLAGVSSASALTPSAPLYPIHPMSLRALVEGSSLIVVADVIALSEWSEGESSWYSDVATLRVGRVLMGDSALAAVSVAFMPSMTCPSPARYDDAQQVLAFLTPERSHEGVYVTTGLSYGSKALSDEDIAIYEARIVELLVILGLPSGSTRDRAMARWQLTCLADPATRGEALIDLPDGRDGYQPHGKDIAPLPDWMAHWSDTEQRSLVDLILADPGISYEVLGVLDLLDELGLDDPRLSPWLLDKAQREDEGDAGAPWPQRFYLSTLAGRSLDPFLLNLIKEYSAPKPRGVTDESWQASQRSLFASALRRAAVMVAMEVGAGPG